MLWNDFWAIYLEKFLGKFRLIFSLIYKYNFREKERAEKSECCFRNNFTPVLEGNRCSIFFPCESFDISQRPNRFWEAIEMADFLGKKESDKVVRIQPKYINLKSSKILSSHGQQLNLCSFWIIFYLQDEIHIYISFGYKVEFRNILSFL